MKRRYRPARNMSGLHDSAGEVVPGRANITFVYQGQRYQFSSNSEKSLFSENPERFLPAENGQCVVTWLNKWRPGLIELPAIFGDHVYFFSSTTMRERFLKNPERYVDRTGRAYREVRDAVLR